MAFKNKKSSTYKEFKEITKTNEFTILKDISEIDQIDEKMQFANKTGNISGSDNNVQAKIKHVIELHVMGISTKTIFSEITKLAPVKGWIPYTSEAGVKTVISNYFKNYSKPTSGDGVDHLEGLKESMYAQQEHIIEKASLFVLSDKKKNWTPFEYMSALKELFAMRQQTIENKNWNDSKKNINATNMNVTNQLNVFVDNSRKIAFGKVENPVLDSLKLKLEERFKQKNLEN